MVKLNSEVVQNQVNRVRVKEIEDLMQDDAQRMLDAHTEATLSFDGTYTCSVSYRCSFS